MDNKNYLDSRENINIINTKIKKEKILMKQLSKINY